MGVTTVVKDYGTDILDAIRDNDLKRLRAILDKQLRTDQQFQALCITDIRHRPTKKFACPLILAARQEDPVIIKYMLKHGVDPNFVHHTIYTSKRRETVTALHIAVDLSHYATVEALLEANANPNLVDHSDETPLHIAIKKADRVMTRMLLAKGANPSIKDRHDNAALHIATLYGHLQLVKTLLKHDADVYQRGATGAIPSHIAAREGHIHLIQVFCARDAGNINVKIPCFSDGREVAPLHLAAENGHVETVIALLDQFHAEVNLRDSAKNTALHCVVLDPYQPSRMRDRDFYYATAKVLVRYHVSINEKNSRGNTALHLAAAHYHPKIVELLLSVGANPFIENDDRAKPVDLVPESDSVTRQMLKTAMSNPRPATLDASMVSYQHDLHNLSMMPGVVPILAGGQAPHQTSTLRRGLLQNGHIPGQSRSHVPGASGSHQLQRSISNTSSLMANETSKRRHSKHAIQSPDHNSEIALYANVTKTDSSVVPGLTIRSPISPIEPVNNSVKPGHSSSRDLKREDRHRKSDHGHKSASELVAVTGANQSNSAREKSRSSRERNLPSDSSHPPTGYSSKKDKSFETSRKTREHRRSVSAERHSQSFSHDTEKHRHGKHKSSHKNKSAHKSYDDIAGELEDNGFHDDEYGVRVHSVPGKASTIAVEYAGGPIIIAVDTENNGEEKGFNESGGSTSDSSSSDDDERTARKKRKKKAKKEKKKEAEKRKKNKKVEKEKSRSKRNDENRSDDEEDDDDDDDDDDVESVSVVENSQKRRSDEPIYTNQPQIQLEKKRLEEHLRLLEEQRLMEEEREKQEADKQKQDKDEQKRKRKEERELRRAQKREENERRRAKKLLRRMQRQNFEEPEAPVVFDAKPVVVYPSEVLNQPDYDSDELETEQLMTLQRLKQKAAQVTLNLSRRWTDAEDDIEEISGSRLEPFRSDGGVKLRKPPRPVVSDADNSNSGLDETAASFEHSHNPTPMPRLSLLSDGYPDVTASNDKGQKFETSVRELASEVKVERVTVSHVVNRGSSSQPVVTDRKRWIDAKLVEKEERFVEEPIPDDSPAHLASTSVEEGTLVMQSQSSRRTGLKMHVTGDVPKAYSRADKDSARKAFILAPPVGIESSGEASDSDLNLSRSSNADTLSDKLRHVRSDKSDQLARSNGHSQPRSEPGDKPTNRAAYPQPYVSFGKIEPRVDALEQAMLENEIELKMEEFWRQSKTTSTVAQVYHKTLTKPHSGNIATNASNIATNDHVDSFTSSSDSDQDVKAVVVDTKPSGLIQAKKVIGTPTLLAGIISRPDLLLKTGKQSKDTLNELSRSSEGLSYCEDLEQYDEEPSFRRPSSRSISRDSDLDLDCYEQEPGNHKPNRALEDDEVAMINGEIKKTTKKKNKEAESSKKTRKTKRTTNVDEELEEEMRYKSGSVPSFLVSKPGQVTSQNISADVWKEAMASRPIASSEAFEISPSDTKERLTTVTAEERRKNKRLARLKTDMERSDLQWNPELLSGDDDLSKETLDDLSCSSYIMTHNLITNGWDENYNETNLDDFVAANESGVKVLEVRARDTSKTVVGRRQQRAAETAKYDDKIISEQWAVEHSDDVIVDDVTASWNNADMSASEELKFRDKRDKEDRRNGQRQSGRTTIPITAVDANSTVETAIDMSSDEDEHAYYNNNSRQSVNDSIQLWQDRDDDSEEEEHMYAYIDSDMDRLPSNTSLNKRWEAVPAEAPAIRQPRGPDGKPLPLPKPPHLSTNSRSQPQPAMRRIIPPISPVRSISSRPETVDDEPNERPGRLESIKAFVRGDPGSFHRVPASRRSRQRLPHQQSYDAYTSESEVTQRRRYTGHHHYGSGPGQTNQTRSFRFGAHDIYSEAEASDFEGPPALVPGKSVKESALEALNAGRAKRRPYKSIILIHPGHHDKNFNHIRRMLRPKRKRYPGLTFVPSVGRYGDSALDARSRTPNRLQSGSETEPDDGGLVDFTQYDIIARLWMERIRAQSVHKCSTMFLSLLPPGTELPRELTAGYRQPGSTYGDDSAMPPQWVMARSRTLGVRRSRRSSADNLPEEELYKTRSTSPTRQSILFFKVGGNWMDMAWVLFDGLQTDPETVRMIRDIQLKNPGGLAEQMHDLMHRWWSRKGRGATIEQLHRALDSVHIPYIREEFNDRRTSVIPYSDTEDDLDVGEITDANPNVSRLLQEYEMRSLDATINAEHAAPPLPAVPPPSTTEDAIWRQTKQKSARAERQRTRSRLDSSSELRPVHREHSDSGHDSGSEERRKTAVVHPQPSSSSSNNIAQ